MAPDSSESVPTQTNGAPTDEELDNFAELLAGYSATLDDNEVAVLWRLLVRGMDPIQRMQFRDVAELLDPKQQAFLVALDHEGSQPPTTEPTALGLYAVSERS